MSHFLSFVRTVRRLRVAVLLGLCCASCCAFAAAGRAAQVSVHLVLKTPDGRIVTPSEKNPVVVWLSPLGKDGQPIPDRRVDRGKTFAMVQKDKQFHPHLLVISTGSLVSFPNRDPFFHNVFSLFNGRRFDLGLYQGGSSPHLVPFDREGISYIFCNIHPDMGAIIVSVATPYFTVAKQSSSRMDSVPPGRYLLHVWAEDAVPSSVAHAEQRIRVDAASSDAGEVRIDLEPPQPHADMFGKPYSEHPDDNPY